MYQFTEPCFESAFRLDVDQVKITGQAVTVSKDRQVLVFEVRLVEPHRWCASCGGEGRSRGSRSRLLTHCPNGTRPVKLLVRLRCYICVECATYWSEQIPWGVMLCVDSGTCGKDLGYVYAPTPPRVLC